MRLPTSKQTGEWKRSGCDNDTEFRLLIAAARVGVRLAGEIKARLADAFCSCCEPDGDCEYCVLARLARVAGIDEDGKPA